jgi:hypothetical protein
VQLKHAALQLYPPVPVNTCTALKTTVLLIGSSLDKKSLVLIPKRTAIAFSVYTLHKCLNLYSIDAELFHLKR